MQCTYTTHGRWGCTLISAGAVYIPMPFTHACASACTPATKMKADQKASPYRLSKMAGRGSDRRRSSMDCQNLLIWNVRGLNSGFFFLPVALVFACCERVGLAVFAWLTGLAMLVI
jgi:hypothetical protein